jgi:hypothetical protein
MPFSIFLSHSGALPFSVANWTSKPAFLNAVYGTAVSERGGHCQLFPYCEIGDG